jgi:hypothetical protein
MLNTFVYDTSSIQDAHVSGFKLDVEDRLGAAGKTVAAFDTAWAPASDGVVSSNKGEPVPVCPPAPAAGKE